MLLYSLIYISVILISTNTG